MSRESNQPDDCVAWARRINGRWIVHHGLDRSLSAYLDHLERTDPERLMRSCHLARKLTHEIEPGEDPKPWFYGGIFSLATVPEARQFLAGHSFLSAIVPCLQDESEPAKGLDAAATETREKISRIRETLERLAKSSGV